MGWDGVELGGERWGGAEWGRGRGGGVVNCAAVGRVGRGRVNAANER